ncbi:hypothetical protein ACFWTE_27070 [Nocardiopsis sp. NPDC058631]|uniref:hypothetical protein n=1 Tax=Nocardiopsis sp. NPDC058631 TaxID=3346566 RepID=UPI003666001A
MSAYEYLDEEVAGAGFLPVAASHVLDVVEAVLGDITGIDARTELLWPQVRLPDTGGTTVREVPDHLDAIVRTSSVDMGEVCAGLARDIEDGTHHTPGLGHALHNSRLIARVEQAARTGVRQ